MAQSLASVAEPPLPNRISLPPCCRRSWMACAALSDLLGFLAGDAGAQLRVVLSLHADRCGHLFDDVAGGLLLRSPRNGIEEGGIADVVAQFACSKKTCTVSQSV